MPLYWKNSRTLLIFILKHEKKNLTFEAIIKLNVLTFPKLVFVNTILNEMT